MGTPNKSYELKKITIIYFISFIWLIILNFVERRHFYFALRLCIFVARWNVTSGTAATLPPPSTTPLEGDYTNKIHSFNNNIVHAGVFQNFCTKCSLMKIEVESKGRMFPRILVFISLRRHYLG